MPFKDKNRYKTPEYKALQAEWSRNWYKRNRACVIANNVERKKETREWYYDYHRGDLLDLGVAGQFEQIEAKLHVTEE